MSKTQKIILFIGITLIGLALVLLLVNTVLKSTKNKDSAAQPDTSLFSLFERPIPVNTSTEDSAETPSTDTDEPIRATPGADKNYVAFSSRPTTTFIPIEKTVDQISFSPDKKTPDPIVKRQGIRYVAYDGIIYEKYDGEDEVRISSTITNRLGEAFLFGDSVIYRYSREDMQTIETFLGTVSKKEPNIGVVGGDYLPKNIRSLALNQTSGRFAGVLADESRQSAQILLGRVGKVDRQTLLKTSFTDWLVDWLDDANLVLTSRASGKVIGSAYTVNIGDSSKTKITSGYGLTTKALPFGAGLIISTVDKNNYSVQLYKDKKLGYTPLKTIADKCTASQKVVLVCAIPTGSNGVQPDDWYKGEVNYQDSIISYNTENGSQKVLLSENGFDVDKIEPSIDGTAVYYRNKLDGFIYKTKTNLDTQ